MLNLSIESLDWALRHNKWQDTDIMPRAFEFDAIAFNWTQNLELRSNLHGKDILTWKARCFRQCLSPKNRLSYRICTQLDPLDALVYAALVYEIGFDIEQLRVPIEKEVVFSHRFEPNETDMFAGGMGWNPFARRVHELANSPAHEWVMVTDIADFFTSLSVNCISKALEACSKTDHSAAIVRLLTQWNESSPTGLPIGPTPSRLLSELVLAKVDEELLQAGCVFCRCFDDYVFFCESEATGHELVALLAKLLYEVDGLSLRAEKTRVMTTGDYRRRFDETDVGGMHALVDRFLEIVSDTNVPVLYEPIDYDQLSARDRERLDELDFSAIVNQQFSADGPLDIPVLRFSLDRLAERGIWKFFELVTSQVSDLPVVLRSVLRSLERAVEARPDEAERAEAELLGLLNSPVVRNLEYCRCWILNTYANGIGIASVDRLVDLQAALTDEFSQRELILAIGKSGMDEWFRQAKTGVMDLRSWERRAFLAAAISLPAAESSQFYRKVQSQLDELEKAIVSWAQLTNTERKKASFD